MFYPHDIAIDTSITLSGDFRIITASSFAIPFGVRWGFPNIGGCVGEYLAGGGWVLVEAGLDDAGGRVAAGGVFVSLFPVALAVPEGA